MKENRWKGIILGAAVLLSALFILLSFREQKKASPGISRTNNSAFHPNDALPIGGTSQDEIPRAVKRPSLANWSRGKLSIKLFDPERLQNEPAYRLLVWEYWLERDLRSRIASGNPEIRKIYDLFEKYGIEKHMAAELVRKAYEDLSEIERFKGFAAEAKESGRQRELELRRSHTGDEKLLETRLKSNEQHAAAGYQHWSDFAERFKEASTRALERDTGITNPEFFQELHAMPITTLATPLATNMAWNERILAP